MYQDFFKFPKGMEVEFTLTRNKTFDNLVLRGVVIRYSEGIQTIYQRGQIKSYKVNVVQINTLLNEFTVDVNCIITKPTQETVDEVNRLLKGSVTVEKKIIPRKEGAFKLGDVAKKTSMWIYVASRNSKLFHATNSVNAKKIAVENMVKFESKAKAEASGRKYASK